ncbi:MAG TPA: hypothetical protein VG737_15920 [Cyclobacteriaceae bacterium]|nr:hypothetical protein [Cyclobacteriaceae bacterium]
MRLFMVGGLLTMIFVAFVILKVDRLKFDANAQYGLLKKELIERNDFKASSSDMLLIYKSQLDEYAHLELYLYLILFLLGCAITYAAIHLRKVAKEMLREHDD